MTRVSSLLRCLAIWASLLSVALVPGVAQSSTSVSQVCDHAAVSAAKATGVPLSVLRAISLTETGRKRSGEMQPWPWTVNMEGTGRWFDDRTSALAYAKRHHARGARSFDVGCFQINYKWHGDAFASIDAMFDPEANALYAARFLSTLFDEFGNWVKAAGAYHSRTPKYANRYEARFVRYLEGLTPLPEVAVAQPPAPVEVPKENLFPLLVRTTNRSALASLVPLSAASRTRFIEAESR